jgi:hypothetical protein
LIRIAAFAESFRKLYHGETIPEKRAPLGAHAG